MLKKHFEQLTKGYTQVPLFYATFRFDEPKGKRFALELHPSLQEDAYIVKQLHLLCKDMDNRHNLENEFEKQKKKHKEVPLFSVTFNLKKFLKNGEKGSCDIDAYKAFSKDPLFVERLQSSITYIRENHDMVRLTE